MCAGSGGLPGNQCRKPQRVSTQWQSIHLPDPDTHRAISPCLQPCLPSVVICISSDSLRAQAWLLVHPMHCSELISGLPQWVCMPDS